MVVFVYVVWQIQCVEFKISYYQAIALGQLLNGSRNKNKLQDYYKKNVFLFDWKIGVTFRPKVFFATQSFALELVVTSRISHIYFRHQ